MSLHAKMREILLYAGIPQKSYDFLDKFKDSPIVNGFLKELEGPYLEIKGYIDDFPIAYWDQLDKMFGKSKTTEQRQIHQQCKILRKMWRDRIKDVKDAAKQNLSEQNSQRLQNRSPETGTISGDSQYGQPRVS